MWINIATPAANSMLDTLADSINAGGAGTLEIYSGDPPSNADEPATRKNLLGRLKFSLPATKRADSRALVFNTISEEYEARRDAKVTWGRVRGGNGSTVLDCDAGDESDGPMIVFNRDDFVAGGPIRVKHFSIVFP